jgi:4-carboxymuconolactone decarboxylase
VSDRLPMLRPADLSDDQRELYDEIAGGPRAAGPQLFALTAPDGGLNGPFNAMLFAPRLGRALQGLGSAVRYQTGLTARVREIAILVVATQWDSAFERYAHEAVGRAAGLTEAEIIALREDADLQLADPTERAALSAVRALVRRSDLDDGEFESAQAVLGHAALVELSTLVGYYATLALQLRLFRVPAPPLG